MKMQLRVIQYALSVCLMASTAACTQLPTEKQTVVDQRPELAFKPVDERTYPARVILDGVDVGQVSDYLYGQRSLKTLSGNHQIRITMSGQILLEERFYLSDGVSKFFVVR